MSYSWLNVDGRRHAVVRQGGGVDQLPRRAPADVFTERLPIVAAPAAVTPEQVVDQVGRWDRSAAERRTSPAPEETLFRIRRSAPAEPAAAPLFVDPYAEPPTLPPVAPWFDAVRPGEFAGHVVPVPPSNALLYAAGTLDRTCVDELRAVGRWLQSWATATHRPADPGQPV